MTKQIITESNAKGIVETFIAKELNKVPSEEGIVEWMYGDPTNPFVGRVSIDKDCRNQVYRYEHFHKDMRANNGIKDKGIVKISNEVMQWLHECGGVVWPRYTRMSVDKAKQLKKSMNIIGIDKVSQLEKYNKHINKLNAKKSIIEIGS
tara:strand:+ start:507 stop:953 length:447 start_codon:yes stop_codon:yes gene_type:complete